MRNDSIEFGFASAAARARRNRRRDSLKHIAHPGDHEVTTAAVIDEAIAAFDGDVANSSVPHAIDKSLVANLSAQLETLDHQREHLMALLRGIDAATL